MIRLIRIALQVVLALLLVTTVIGFFSPDTGTAEKAVLVLIGGAVVWAAGRVRGIAARPA